MLYEVLTLDHHHNNIKNFRRLKNTMPSVSRFMSGHTLRDYLVTGALPPTGHPLHDSSTKYRSLRCKLGFEQTHERHAVYKSNKAAVLERRFGRRFATAA